MESIRILGTGSYLPSKILTNYELEKSGLDTTNEWIVQRTGVSERRIAEAIKLGFNCCLMPSLKSKLTIDSTDIQLLQAGSIAEAVRLGLTREGRREIARGENTAQE